MGVVISKCRANISPKPCLAKIFSQAPFWHASPRQAQDWLHPTNGMFSCLSTEFRGKIGKCNRYINPGSNVERNRVIPPKQNVSGLVLNDGRVILSKTHSTIDYPLDTNYRFFSKRSATICKSAKITCHGLLRVRCGCEGLQLHPITLFHSPNFG